MSLSTLMVWVRRFHLNRAEVGDVASLRRGREYGKKRTLSEADEQASRDVVLHETPQVLGLPFALWNRHAVQQAVYPALLKRAKAEGAEICWADATALSNQGQVRFALHEGSINAAREWLEQPKNQARIELFYLPSYAPEHNPDEWINRDLKTHLCQAAPSRMTRCCADWPSSS